uniref:Uncharacterized protein n=1 Tax=Acrobeloides nanus TaxID=290746 RepID=A0A914DXA4_9BILA
MRFNKTPHSPIRPEYLKNFVNRKDFISKDGCLSSSPDLNPMDYSVWAILESKANAKAHKNLESLKKALQKAWKKLNNETLRAVDDFPKKLQACKDVQGGYFE